MARTLADALQNRNVLGQAPGMNDEGQRLATLFRAKSGKAVAAPEVAQSSLAEQQAVQAGQQQWQQQISPAAQIQSQQLQAEQAAQEQRGQLQRAELEQGRRFNTEQNKAKTQELLQGFKQDMGRLDLARNKSDVQLFTQGLRLQNKQYVNDLQLAGQRNRLDNDLAFQRQYYKSVFGDSEELLRKQLAGREILSVKDSEYKRALADMGIEDAYAAFAAEKKSAQQRAPWEALGSVATIGAAAGAKYAGSDEEIS